MNRWLFLSFFALAGCFQTFNEDSDLHTIPITNNPHVVPNHGSGLPMMGGSLTRSVVIEAILTNCFFDGS